MFTLTMFVTYCRPFELFKLAAKDLVMTVSMGIKWSLVINKSDILETSKMGMTDETICLDNKEMPWLGDQLHAYLAKTGTSRMFNLEYREFMDAWKLVLQQLGLPKSYAVPYQVRHSGASWDRLKQHRTQLEVKFRGRWKTDASMARYEKHAMVMQKFEELPKTLQRQALQAPLLLKQLVQRSCSPRAGQ